MSLFLVYFNLSKDKHTTINGAFMPEQKLSERLQELEDRRKKLGISKADMSRASGLSHRAYYHWYQKGDIPPEYIPPIKEYFDTVSDGDLFHNERSNHDDHKAIGIEAITGYRKNEPLTAKQVATGTPTYKELDKLRKTLPGIFIDKALGQTEGTWTKRVRTTDGLKKATDEVRRLFVTIMWLSAGVTLTPMSKARGEHRAEVVNVLELIRELASKHSNKIMGDTIGFLINKLEKQLEE